MRYSTHTVIMHRDTRKRWLKGLGILILTTLAIIVVIPQHPKLSLGSFQRDLNVKLGLDLQGGSHLVYRAKFEEAKVDDPAEAVAGVRDVIERRVNAFGISEPVVQTNVVGDEYRVIVELAGIHDPQEAIDKIGETPQLDFRIEVPGEGATTENTDSTTVDLAVPTFERTELTGKHLKRAVVNFDQLVGTPEVSLEFDGEGSDLFAQITKNNIGKRVAIYLDGVPISAPVVQSEITNGQAVITGGFTLDEAKQLARRLNAGALPVPIELIGQQSIGPSLGARSIQQSIVAGLVGLALVMLWMIAYYRLPGVIAAIALVLYGVYFLALIKFIPVTLTLAGIAGFILSIGMAVDANVLIFERVKENLRDGKTLPYSIQDGFKQAWESIWGSNISSLITGLILYIFGTSLVKGFALTFSMGIVLSMFTAIAITRGLLDLVLLSPKLHKLALFGVRQKHS